MGGLPLFSADTDEELLFGGDEESLFGSEEGDDDLFGGSDDLLTDIESSGDSGMDTSMLTSEQPVVIGGSYNFSLTPGWGWKFDESDDIGGINANLSSKLYFDARPDEHVRVFGKAVLSYPFEVSEEFSSLDRVGQGTMVDDSDSTNTYTGTIEYKDGFFTTSRSFSDILQVQELFSDFTVGDDLFVRVGKQNLTWGVGYFFSPANLLNVTSIDPMDPEAELTGPLSIKVNKPVGIDNLYGYVVIPGSSVDLDALRYAAKYEKVIGKSEIGIGGLYRYGEDPVVMTTLSTSIRDVALFAEGTAAFSSFDDVEFSATAGGRYSWNSQESDFGFMAAAQYFYDGSSENYPHKLAANLSVTLTDRLSVGTTWLDTGADDLPAYIVPLVGSDHAEIKLVQPNVTWSPVDYVSIQIAGVYLYGDFYQFLGAPILGEAMGATVRVSLGNTSF
jgi:hypothetical protein